MKTLLTCMLAVLLLVAPACDVAMELKLGTIGVGGHVRIDEWARANILKSLEVLVAKAVEDDAADEEAAKEAVVDSALEKEAEEVAEEVAAEIAEEAAETSP